MKKIYYNGSIITMEDPLYAEAICVQDGIIKSIGNFEEVLKEKDTTTEVIDLDGATLLPGFIDPHSHITSFAQTLGTIDLDGVSSFEELQDLLSNYKNQHQINPGEWVIGFGYDQNSLKEKCHPTKELLDLCYPENPVVITHKSGHMGVLNTLGLKELNISSDTEDPEGGMIGRVFGTLEPNGYLEETAFTMKTSEIPEPSFEELMRNMKEAEQIYIQNGITTVQDGITKRSSFELLKAIAERNEFTIDVISYLDVKEKEVAHENVNYVKRYENHLKIGGYKIFLDGSPQGRTAWMSMPYEGESEYKGYPILKDEQLIEQIEYSLKEEMQLLAHCNGDEAAEQLIRCFEIANSNLDIHLYTCRPVMIHAQFVRKDQLVRMKKLGMIPSFFIAHTYYWGDVHIKNFGLARASRISPAHTALKEGLVYTFHQDTPVMLPDMLFTIWCAVNRITKSGIILGNDEKITPLEALKAITIHAAYQYYEEMKKGSLKIGKEADFVILDQNPLTVDPMIIKDIQVLETIKHGKTIYQKGGVY